MIVFTPFSNDKRKIRNIEYAGLATLIKTGDNYFIDRRPESINNPTAKVYIYAIINIDNKYGYATRQAIIIDNDQWAECSPWVVLNITSDIKVKPTTSITLGHEDREMVQRYLEMVLTP